MSLLLCVAIALFSGGDSTVITDVFNDDYLQDDAMMNGWYIYDDHTGSKGNPLVNSGNTGITYHGPTKRDTNQGYYRRKFQCAQYSRLRWQADIAYCSPSTSTSNTIHTFFNGQDYGNVFGWVSMGTGTTYNDPALVTATGCNNWETKQIIEPNADIDSGVAPIVNANEEFEFKFKFRLIGGGDYAVVWNFKLFCDEIIATPSPTDATVDPTRSPTTRQPTTQSPTTNPTPSPTDATEDPTISPTTREPTTKTPTPSPTAANTGEQHKIVIGSQAWLTHSSGDKLEECRGNDETTGIGLNSYGNEIGVQCCSMDGSSGYRKGFENGCLQGVSYDIAKTACQNRGDRLCTAQEVEANIGKGSGCSHDARHVWTSDECGAHKIVVGHSKSIGDKPEECRYDDETTGVASNSQGNEIGVQCCSQDGSIAYRQGFINGGTNGCLQGVTFNVGKTACQVRGYRLCTAQEVESDIGGGVGCMHDYRHVWTSDSCDTIVGIASSTNGINVVFVSARSMDIILGLICLLLVVNMLYLTKKVYQSISRKSGKYKLVSMESSDADDIDAIDIENN